MNDIMADRIAYLWAQKESGLGPDRGRWVKGANGLWRSYDPVAQRKRERAANKAAKEAAKLAKAG